MNRNLQANARVQLIAANLREIRMSLSMIQQIKKFSIGKSSCNQWCFESKSIWSDDHHEAYMCNLHIVWVTFYLKTVIEN